MNTRSAVLELLHTDGGKERHWELTWPSFAEFRKSSEYKMSRTPVQQFGWWERETLGTYLAQFRRISLQENDLSFPFNGSSNTVQQLFLISYPPCQINGHDNRSTRCPKWVRSRPQSGTTERVSLLAVAPSSRVACQSAVTAVHYQQEQRRY
jgi:hypothetical protein